MMEWNATGYVRLHDNRVQIRDNFFGEWGGHFTNEEARIFAARIFDLVAEAEEKKQPEHWPPQSGDVWRHSTGSEYFVSQDGRWYSPLTGGHYPIAVSTPAFPYWTLAYRNGVEL